MTLPDIDFVMTSPPYMNRANHPENPLTGYRTRDGNYSTYIGQLGYVFETLGHRLRPGGTIVINAANIADNPVTTLAWDLAAEVSKHLRFIREVAVDWSPPAPGLTGDYCLLFQRWGA